jgi:UDP-2,3-diacylglucosamine hydrolase
LSVERNIYFASDFHLGLDTVISSTERESIVVEWLTHIAPKASKIYLVGDVFDYWFEYKSSVPKGHFRLFNALHSIINSGVEVHYFHGNHDLWHFGYMSDSVGVIMHERALNVSLDGKQFYIAHGDGLDPNDRSFTFFKALMTNKICQKFFACLHPTWGLALMKRFSKMSRGQHEEFQDANAANDIPISQCEILLKGNPDIDYFIMGHWHHPIRYTLSNQSSIYVNLGDWMTYFSYAEWNGQELSLKIWKK